MFWVEIAVDTPSLILTAGSFSTNALVNPEPHQVPKSMFFNAAGTNLGMATKLFPNVILINVASIEQASGIRFLMHMLNDEALPWVAH